MLDIYISNNLQRYIIRNLLSVLLPSFSTRAFNLQKYSDDLHDLMFKASPDADDTEEKSACLHQGQDGYPDLSCI